MPLTDTKVKSAKAQENISMDILQTTANLRYIEFALTKISTESESYSIKQLKDDFRSTYKTDMPYLANQYFGLARLISLIFIRESFKNEGKAKNKDLAIVRHAITHNQVGVDKDGFTFTCGEGTKTFSFSELNSFCETIEKGFFGV